MKNRGDKKMAGGWTPGKEGAGPDGKCICIKCNYRVPKKRGLPCMEEKCTHCGSILLREGGAHYIKAINK